MRKITAFMHVSLDGFAAGPNGEINWAAIDDEIFQDAIDLAATADAALYGRVTYEMMQGYWPTVLSNPNASELARHHAEWVENIRKIVVSTTLKTTTWNNSTVIGNNIGDELSALQQQHGGALLIFGSPGLVHSLMQLDLIDEYRLNINPVAIGTGVPFFQGVKNRQSLKLLKSRVFTSGVLGVHYQVQRSHAN